MLTNYQKKILQTAFDFDGDLKRSAAHLNYSKKSLKTVLGRIYEKLMVHNMQGAFRIGLTEGWIDLQQSIERNPPTILTE